MSRPLDEQAILITSATDGIGRGTARATPQAYDGEARRRLWQESLKLIGIEAFA